MKQALKIPQQLGEHLSLNPQNLQTFIKKYIHLNFINIYSNSFGKYS